MAVIFNTKLKARYDEKGNIKKSKIEGFAPVSFAFGQLLSIVPEEETENGYTISAKGFFLLNSMTVSTGEYVMPSGIRRLTLYNGINNELMPFSKKFSMESELVKNLKIGDEYWLAYCSQPKSGSFDKEDKNKLTIYEELKLLYCASEPGNAGLTSIFEPFKLVPKPT
ncbi:hypothetical protein BCD67_24860 [Oscillatoriales cyanobacterium USR001]|nr:hypothetical protein BCD67_24860 [Oscillatoriales cyanobacterium USR001]